MSALRITRKAKTINGRATEIKRIEKHAALAREQGSALPYL